MNSPSHETKNPPTDLQSRDRGSIVAENITTETCFNFEIQEGTIVSGKSTTTNNKASVEMTSGTAPFDVFVNGENVLRTMSNSFDVDVMHGDEIEVKTSVSCEGSFKETILNFDQIKAYPNPTFGPMEVALPVEINEVVIEFYNISGQIVSSKTYQFVNGKAQVDISNFAVGVYQLKLVLDKPIILNIIKQ